MLKDKEVSAGIVMAFGSWALAVFLCGAACVTDSADLGRISLLIVGVAVCATVRMYFVDQCELLRNAFELGRDSVTRIRR